MRKGLKIDTVYFIEPVAIRAGSETRPERVVSYKRHVLSFPLTNWLLVEVGEHKTWVPIHNIRSLVELPDDGEENQA